MELLIATLVNRSVVCMEQLLPVCQVCDGMGIVYMEDKPDDTCPVCSGSGSYDEGKYIKGE